jgi:ribosomal protein S18 acetylase RimI-like enzyme
MLNHASYQKLATLNNGRRVTIRFLKGQDRDALVRFFQQAPIEDVQFCKEDVKNSKVVDYWLNPENCHRIMTLVAHDMETQQPVATLNLQRGQKAALNVGEIRQILVTRPFQGLGLGSEMLDELIRLASQEKLAWLKVEVVAEMKSVIKAFRSRDFEVKAIFEDYFMDSKGVRYDVALMMRPMIQKEEDF